MRMPSRQAKDDLIALLVSKKWDLARIEGVLEGVVDQNVLDTYSRGFE